MNKNYCGFLMDNIERGLLNNINVGMVRRTLKFIGDVKFEEFVYLPCFRKFVVLRIKSRFEE